MVRAVAQPTRYASSTRRRVAVVRVVVEVGGWEHECCGPAYEVDTVVRLTCWLVSGGGGQEARYVETHHDLASEKGTTLVRGRVTDIRVVHRDGSTEPVMRVPSGKALRGFDDLDDGHLERPWTSEPVVNDSGEFRLTITGADESRPRHSARPTKG